MAFWNRSTYKHKVRDPKTGKFKTTEKVTLTGKQSNADKVLQAKGMTGKPTKESNVRDLQIQRHNENMARIAGKTTNIAAAIGQAGNVMSKAFDNSKKAVYGNTTTTSPTVDTLVNGGAQTASDTRDEDREDEDSEWVA